MIYMIQEFPQVFIIFLSNKKSRAAFADFFCFVYIMGSDMMFFMFQSLF